MMDWYEDDELRKQWEEVSRVEEQLRSKKAEGVVLHCEARQRVPELVASQLMVKGKKVGRRREQGTSQDGPLKRWMRK